MTRIRAHLSTVFLVCLALGLGLLLVLEQSEPSSSEKLARQNNVFEFFRGEELSAVVIDEKGSSLGGVRLRKDEASADRDAYFLGKDGNVLADPASVGELLGALEFATWGRRIEEADVDLDGFGLRSPQLEVHLQFGGRSSRLLIGQAAPAPTETFYARVQGPSGSTSTGVVPKKLVDQLLREQRSFRGRLLLPYAKSELRELEIDGRGQNLRMVADAAGFRLAQGSLRVDRELGDGVLFQLARVSVSEFLDDAQATRALAESPATLTIKQIPKSGPTVTVRLGAPCPGHPSLIVAARVEPDPLAGCVTSTVLPALLSTSRDLVDTSLSSLGADEIDRVTISSAGGQFELVRKDSAFELLDRGHDAVAVNLEEGNEFLGTLTNRRGALFENAAQAASDPGVAWPDGPPTGSLTLTGTGPLKTGKHSAEVRSGLRIWMSEEWWFVQRDDDGARLVFPRSDAWFLEGDTAWAKPRQLVAWDESSITSISVKLPSGTSRLVRKGESWTLSQPSGFDLDARLSGDWLRALAKLEVVRFVPRAAALGAPWLELEVVRDGGSEPLRIFVGARTRAGFFARSTQSDLTFVLAPETVRLFETSPIDRAPFLLNPKTLETLRVENERSHYTFERRGDALMELSGRGDPELGASLLEAINELAPQAAVHVGAARADEGLARPRLVLSGKRRDPEGNLVPFRLSFGAVGVFQGRVVQWARAEGVDASFAIDRVALQALEDRL